MLRIPLCVESTSNRSRRTRLRSLVALATFALTLAASLVGLAGISGASGTVYHVATGGSDAAAGSESAPFATVTHAVRVLRPGDTLLVHDGTYHERVRNPSISAATATAPIRVQAAPGERPVIQGLFWLKGASHWQIRGINVTWSSANFANEHMVKFTDGTGWSYENAEVWGAHSFAAILVAGTPSNFALRGLHVHHTYATNGTNQDHLIYLNSGTGGGVVERNVLAHSPNGRAVKIGGASETGAPVDNLVIRYNTMFDNLGPSNVQIAYNSSNNLVERNIMVRSAPNRSAVTTHKLVGTGNVVRDNVVWEVVRPLDLVDGLIDGGGNLLLDPMFVSTATADFRTLNPLAADYGRYAGDGGSDGSAGSTDTTTTSSTTTTTSTSTSTSTSTTTTTTAPTRGRRGYWVTSRDGGVFAFGDAGFHGSTGNIRLNQPIVGTAGTPSGNGYWMVASDGGIFAFGDAAFRGSTGNIRLNQPIVGMAPTPTGRGYWLVAADGGIFAFGDATFGGSTGHLRLNRPIVGMASTETGRGYWMVASDGGIFAFGDARFAGSAASTGARIASMAPSPLGGYWLLADDGRVFAYGGAPGLGAAPVRPAAPAVTMVGIR